MRSNCVLIILFCIYCNNVGNVSVYTTDNDANLLQQLLDSVFAKANVTGNFIIAPNEMLALYENLYGTDKEGSAESSSSEEDSDNYSQSYKTFTTTIPYPISVTNTLQGLPHDQAVEQLQQKLPHVKLEQSERAPVKLCQAVTLHSRWYCTFQRRDTHKVPFYHAQQVHVYADAMRKDDMFRYAALPQLNSSALEITLQRRDFKMLILLPDDVEGLPQLEQHLRRNWSLIDEIVEEHLRPSLVRLVLPKFRIAYKLNLSDIFAELSHDMLLDDMDVPTPTADIAHEAQISITEYGIGELERTTVFFWNAFSSLRTTPVKFTINHPFLFVIRNKRGIQFLGHLTRLK